METFIVSYRSFEPRRSSKLGDIEIFDWKTNYLLEKLRILLCGNFLEFLEDYNQPINCLTSW